MHNNGELIVAGSLAYDHILKFPGLFKDHILPDKLHMINLSFLVDSFEKQRGGCAANIAYTLSLLGYSPRILAAAGHDFEHYKQWLDEQEIDTEYIQVFNDDVTATCFITTDKSDNQITGFYVGAMKQAQKLELERAITEDTKFVIVAPDDPDAMMKHCSEAKRLGIPVIYDPSFQVIALSGDQLWENTNGVKTLILNDYEYAVFQEKTGKSESEILEAVDFVVVTLGEKGSEILQKDVDKIVIEPVQVRETCDPTGAGDAYRGGFLWGLLHDLSLEECGQVASLSGAYAVEQYGTQNHSYTSAEFWNRYEDSFGARPQVAGLEELVS